MMAAFGASGPGSHYVGGGDLWGEPTPPPRQHWRILLRVLGSVNAFLVVVGAIPALAMMWAFADAGIGEYLWITWTWFGCVALQMLIFERLP